MRRAVLLVLALTALAVASVRFSDVELRAIHDYFGTHPVAVRPLPPGIRKQLVRGRPLPPGIAQQLLPADLDAVLARRAGLARVIVGRDVLLIEVGTGVILDVLLNVLGRSS